MGGLATAVALCPLNAPAASATTQILRLDVDVPALVQTARDNQDIILKLAQQTADAVHLSPTNNMQNWRDWLELARDAAAGDVLLQINQGPVLDVSVQSSKGVVGLDVFTEAVGELSVTVASDKYLPFSLPLLTKRLPVVTDAASAAERAQAVNEAVAPPPFVRWTERTSFDVWHRGWKNGQVAGVLTLGLGSVYAGAYAYYQQAMQKAEQEAEEKRVAAAAKKKAAAKKASSSETTSSKKKKAPEPKKAVVAVKPEVAAAEETATATAVVSSNGSVALAAEPKKKKRKWYTLWLLR